MSVAGHGIGSRLVMWCVVSTGVDCAGLGSSHLGGEKKETQASRRLFA